MARFLIKEICPPSKEDDVMRFLSFILGCTLLFGAMACAGSNPIVNQDLTPERQVETGTRNLWGVYDVTVDTATLEATVVPIRSAEFRLNVNTFMNANPSLLGLSNLDGSLLPTQGILELDVTLTHPIPNKNNLAGFDVHAIFLSDWDGFLASDTSLRFPTAGSSSYLLNADGWSRWYNKEEFTTPSIWGYVPGLLGNNTEPTATLNGYKFFADGLSSTGSVSTFINNNADDRGYFGAGASNTRHFELQFPMSPGPQLKFQYAVVSSWANPGIQDPAPADFPPAANIQEASYLKLNLSQSSLFYSGGNGGGDISIDLDIYDWQGGTDVEGEIARIIVDSNVLNDPFIDNSPSLIQNTGKVYGTYLVDVPADNVTSQDDVLVWVLVESADPTDYNNGVGAAYPSGAPLTAATNGYASVDDVVPVDPPVIQTGIIIFSGTSECPDRSSDTAGVLQVVATSSETLTYTWRVSEFKNSNTPVPGYDGVPGDGNGKLSINFTDPVWDTISETLLITCDVSDGVNNPVFATPLFMYLDCLVFHANLDDYDFPDNLGWWAFDAAGTTIWTLAGATDNGTSLTGTGALWQTGSGGITSSSQGVLRSPGIAIPPQFNSARVEIDHSYSMTGGSIGGNLELGGILGEPTVGGEPNIITSGQGYDTTISAGGNPLNPHPAWSAVHSPSSLYTSTVTPSNPMIAGGFVIGLQCASSATMADGGWLIDDVRVYAIP